MERVGIVGSGQMGSTIALNFAVKGYEVRVVDVKAEALERARAIMGASLETLIEEGVVSPSAREEVSQRIALGLSLEDLRDCTFVIEAVPEVPAVKKAVFEELDRLLSSEAVLCSNTSGINIFDLVPGRRRSMAVIAHFFAPAHIIPLVEVVREKGTSEEAVGRTLQLMGAIGKVPIVLEGYKPGFLVNRIQRAIGETVLEIIEEGYATPEDIDRAVKLTLGIRLPIVGVVQTFDFQGLDMLLDAMRLYGRVFRFVEEKVKAGHLGVKTSRGIYDYGGRPEGGIIAERDRRFLKVLRFLEEIRAFNPL